MTENELKIELMCYKQYVNPDCDLNNMSKDDLEEFYDLYAKSETYVSKLSTGIAKVVNADFNDGNNTKREGAIYKY